MPIYRDKKRNTYYFVVSVKGKHYCRRGFFTRAIAKKQEADFLVHHKWDFKKLPTFNQLCKLYLAHKQTILKGSTFYKFSLGVNKHFIGHFPDVSLEKLTSQDFDSWRQYLKDYPVKNKNRFLNRLQDMFEYAHIYHDYSGTDHKKLLPFKDYSIHENIDQKFECLTATEFVRFISQVVNDDYYFFMFNLFFFTGLRISELRGLQVKCYLTPKLYIFQQMYSRGGLQNGQLISLKSEASNRVYLLPPFICQLMSKHIENYHLNKDKMFIFFSPSSKCKPIGETTARRVLNYYAAKAGLPPFSFHRFRHSDATFLSDMGLTSEDIKNYLGHSSKEITERIYIHETDEKRQHIANVFQGFYEEKLKQ